MSSGNDEKVRPYHAKDASGQEAVDAVKAVMEHAHERDEAAKKKDQPKKQPKWMLPLGINLGVFAVYLLIAGPQWVVIDPIEGPPQAERVEGLRLAMFLQAQRIEAYRQENGRLPESLEEIGASTPEGVEYVLQGSSQYQLIGNAGETDLIYDSTQSAAEWVGSAEERLRGG